MNACESRLVIAGLSSLALAGAVVAAGRTAAPAPAASADASPLVSDTFAAHRPVTRSAAPGRPAALRAEPVHVYISANLDGEDSSLITTIPGCSRYPLTVSVDDAGAYV